MRIALITCFWVLSFAAIAGEIPTVPANIEIAGVKLKLTGDAQRKIQNDVNALRASDKYFRIKLDRVNLYFPIMERILKEEGVPEVLKYLAVQESALISDAVSSSDAVGYWQFKDFTGREVGMRVDSKIDERKNIVSATKGAAKYFKMNNFYFKNWIYSISAYQAGRGGASKYVKKENFGSDKLTITSKTHWYVLRFIAHVIAFQDEVGDPQSQGLKLREYTKGAGKSLDQIAKEQKLDPNQVKEYNKWLSTGRIPDDKMYTVILPTTGKLPNQPSDQPKERPLTRTIDNPEDKDVYPDELGVAKELKTIFIRLNGLPAVMAGKDDNVVKLALKSKISSSQLIKYNDLSSTESIKTGNIYYTKSKRGRSPIRFHTTQHNESMWDISQKYGIKIKSLAKKNRMSTTDKIKPGRVMWLGKTRPKNTPIEYRKVMAKTTPSFAVKKTPPPPTKTKNPARTDSKPIDKPKPVVIEKQEPIQPEINKENNTGKHLVTAGESLWSIAKEYGLDVDELRKINNLTTESALHIGQMLSLVSLSIDAPETKVSKPVATENKQLTHVVQPGESLWVIARKYGMEVEELRSLNELTNTSVLSVGQVLVTAHEEDITESEKVPVDKIEPTKTAFHKVQSGESLWSIAQKYGLTIDQLTEWNSLTSESTINAGLKLILDSVGSHSKKSDIKSGVSYEDYTVQEGESLYQLSKKFGMTIDEIMEKNNLTSQNLSIGQVLRVKKSE